MSFHVHEHGNGWNVTKSNDDIGMEGEEAAREGIVCRDTGCKLKQFSHEQIDEGVCIPWLFWTRYDPGTKDVVLLEVFIWREIVIENQKDPCSMLLLFEWSEAVSGEAKCNITMIREVIVGQSLISDNNTLFKKRAIMEPIKISVVVLDMPVFACSSAWYWRQVA